MGSIWSRSKETYDPTSIFHTKYGRIRGRRFRIGEDRYVNAFLGIPYASPPVGPLRFKKPQPPESWSNIRECVQHAMRAPQQDMIFERWSMRIPTSEDCLYLNVFAPEWDPFQEHKSGRAVMVWLHGGGFVVHSSANYGDRGICKCLCSKGVIVVTLQYRLGILGFSATGDEHSTPNLGLWDQAMAMNWVKENIAEFGGDPENITVFGQSAGGVCADLLSLSPYTRDLFDKVIAMGGTANCSWALRDVRRVREATISHAYAIGWQFPDNASDSEINESLMKFLRQQPVKLLALGLSGRRLFKENIAGLCFGPVIDNDFIPESISELRKKTPKKICMGGATDYETLLFAGFGRKRLDIASFEQVLDKAIPGDKYQNYAEIRRAAKALYLNERCTNEEIKRACIRLTSDIFVTNGIHDYAEDMLNDGHIAYLYNFEYFNPRGFGLLRWTLPFFAATHGTELTYLFGKSLFEDFRPNATDRVVIDNFTTIFTNFAKFGNPNGGIIEEIEALSEFDKWCYMCIDETVVMQRDFQQRRANFWRRLQEGKLHLPNIEENSRQTQTDMKLDSLNKGQQSGKDCSCQGTQTDCAFPNTEQSQTVNGAEFGNFGVAGDDNPSHYLSSPNLHTREKDEENYEEISVTCNCDIRKRDDEQTGTAEICFVGWSEWPTIGPSENEKDYFGRADGFAESEATGNRLESFNSDANVVSFCQDTAAKKSTEESEGLWQYVHCCQSNEIKNMGTQTHCKCAGAGLGIVHKEDTTITVDSHRRRSDDTMIGMGGKWAVSTRTGERNSDKELSWDAFEEVANV